METLRILHIDTEMTWRGGENQLRLLLSGLAEVARASKGQLVIESHVAVRPGSQAAKRFQAMSDIVRVVELPLRGGFNLKAIHLLKKYCQEHDVQLIDAHTSNAHSYGVFAKFLLPELKLVVHRRVDFEPGRDLINRWKYQTAKVDRYIAISGAIKDILVNYGLASERINVVCSAVDGSLYRQFNRADERQALAKAHGIDEQLVFIGNASAMTHQKGYDVLLRALKILKDKGLKFHCFIAGDGPLRDEIERQRHDLVLDYDVSLLGFIERVPQFLSGLDILAVPSNFEGLGTIILDGIHAGCTVAATAVGGIPEMLTHDVTGLLSPKGDAAALATNLEKLIYDPSLRARLAQSARQHIDAAFSLENMVQGNLKVYRDLLQDQQ